VRVGTVRRDAGQFEGAGVSEPVVVAVVRQRDRSAAARLVDGVSRLDVRQHLEQGAAEGFTDDPGIHRKRLGVRAERGEQLVERGGGRDDELQVGLAGHHVVVVHVDQPGQDRGALEVTNRRLGTDQ
jgi:hypothetical protein